MIILFTEGWIDGILSVFLVIYCVIFGTAIIIKSKKTNARLLSYVGIIIILLGLTWLGGSCDFFIILLTGINMNNTYGIYGFLVYVWLPPAFFFAILVGTELIFPKKKQIITVVYLIISIISEFIIILDTKNSFTFYYPSQPGELLINASITFGTYLFFIIVLYLISLIILDGFGFVYKSIKSKGIVRKKFVFLWVANFIIIGFGVINIFSYLVITTILNNAILIIGFWLYYLGLKEETEESTKSDIKKEIKVKDSLFVLYKRPEQITEEEITFHKEKEICLVCKGKTSRLTYICPKCKALYCIKCSEKLSDLENACWVCNTPFDESKPSKQFEEEQEDIIIETDDLNKKLDKSIPKKSF